MKDHGGRSPTRPRLPYALGVASLGVWISVVLLYLGKLEGFDPYWFIAYTQVNAIMVGGHLPASDAPGWIVLLSEISLTSGAPLSQLLYIPLGGVVMPLTAFSVGRRLGMDRLSCLLFTAYMSIQTYGPGTYSIFAHAWAYPVLLVFIAAFLRIVRGAESRAKWVGIVTVLFVGLHLLYYSVELLALALIVEFALITTLIEARGHKAGVADFAPRSLALAFVAMFVTFDEVIFTTFVPQLSVFSAGNASLSFWARIESLFGLSPTAPEPFRLVTATNAVESWIVGFEALLILLPLLWFALRSAPRVRGSRPTDSRKWRPDSILIWSLLLVSLTDLVAYFFAGLVFLRSIFLLLPLAAFLVFNQMHSTSKVDRRVPLVAVFLAVLVMLSGARFYEATVSGENSRPSIMAQIEPSAAWFFSARSRTAAAVLTDLHTASRFTFVARDQGASFKFEYYDSQRYGSLISGVNPGINDLGIDFVVIDKVSLGAPTYGYNWKIYQPLSGYFGLIENDPNLQQVYDDGFVTILSTA